MKLVGLTLRVQILEKERRDAIDQAWIPFLKACNIMPILIPNNLQVALAILNSINLSGIIFSGGYTLTELGGDAPERDLVEKKLLEKAIHRSLPILGVCRGMQVILQHFGCPLVQVENHVASRHEIFWKNHKRSINSYHAFGSYEARAPLECLAKAGDGVLEAFQHNTLPIKGIMWHPERESSCDPEDILLFKEHFSA